MHIHADFLRVLFFEFALDFLGEALDVGRVCPAAAADIGRAHVHRWQNVVGEGLDVEGGVDFAVVSDDRRSGVRLEDYREVCDRLELRYDRQRVDGAERAVEADSRGVVGLEPLDDVLERACRSCSRP